MRSSFLGQAHAGSFESAGFQAACPALATTTASRSPSSLVVFAGPAGRARRNAAKGPTPRPPPGIPKRPDSGFFAETDPNGKKLKQQILKNTFYYFYFPDVILPAIKIKIFEHCFLLFFFPFCSYYLSCPQQPSRRHHQTGWSLAKRLYLESELERRPRL